MRQQGHLTNPEIEKAIRGFEKEAPQKTEAFPVLIIDDDQWIHRVLTHYLRGWGFYPYSAFDAFEGLAMAIKHRPILILLDIVMPEVKGDVLLKMLKKIELTASIPTIVISGNLNTEILGNTFKNGAVGFLTKPITQTVLQEKIAECLGPAIFTEMMPETV